MADDGRLDRAERRRMRARQRRLVRKFRAGHTPPVDGAHWETWSSTFSELLDLERRVTPEWIDTDRYPLAITNLFAALGFEVFVGPLPRLSGVDREFHLPMLAYQSDRAVLVGNRATEVLADIADIQPGCPVPILGLTYNSAVWATSTPAWTYPVEMLQEGRRLAGAFALGHLALGFRDLELLLRLNPARDRASLRRIAARLGLLSFVQPPIDAVPVHGQHARSNHGQPYTIEDFLAEAARTHDSGARLAAGDVTQARPDEAVSDPEYYLRELGKAKLVKAAPNGSVEPTHVGWTYLRERVLPFPLAQLLNHASIVAREGVVGSARSTFYEALSRGMGYAQLDPGRLLLTVDDIDSFAAVGFLSPAEIDGRLPVAASEMRVKEVITRAIGDDAKKDWGGEQNDIFTTRVVLNGRRVAAAFLLKGPGAKGTLTIAKCGKNGDQLQRLFESSADLFVVQFNGPIHERVVAEARQKVELLRAKGQHAATCAVIDGRDTARLLAAYGGA